MLPDLCELLIIPMLKVKLARGLERFVPVVERPLCFSDWSIELALKILPAFSNTERGRSLH